ncbi:26S proteasome regulatory subunit [Polyrhizophydium stewartii]|uniref:26S proteasome regulatory subunit n=1 Tax=Polyrhizophydium stewartii TaxID=2732419 RepID=A0ABR4N4P7_9FUNG|nr:26S proteasome regulatory subunit [Polyrhizophydium stewartii]
MQVDRDVSGWLAAQRTSAPAELKEYYAKFEDLYDRKLWHQLTLTIEKFTSLLAAAPYLLPLYENFVVDFEKRINGISLVQFLTKAARQIKDPKAALAFLSAQADKLKSSSTGKEAYVLATMEAAHYKQVTGDLDGCKKSIDECEKLLDELPATEPVISAAFYRVSADYYKAKMAYQQYYHNALLFLSSVNIDDLGVQEKQERAYELAMSALLGESLYNFGELLIHPVLDSLKGTIFEWLRNLLFQFNLGDMEGFEKTSRSGDFLKQPLLANSLPFLRQKLCLMTLMEVIFKRSKEARGRMTFFEISRETRVALDEVEHLVMKAFSLGLIRGKIDEVDSVVLVSWVQPRVLEKSQIKTINDRLDDWVAKVHEQVSSLEQNESIKTLLVQ